MVWNIFRGDSKTLFLLWVFAVPESEGLPGNLARRSFDMSQLATVLQPSKVHDSQLGQMASPLQVSRVASGKTAGPRVCEMHLVDQPQYLVADGGKAFQSKEAHFSHSTSSNSYQSAGAHVNSQVTNTKFRMREDKAFVAGDGANGVDLVAFMGNGGMRGNGAMLEKGVHPTNPPPKVIQGSFTNAPASGAIKYTSPPAQRTGVSAHPSSKPVRVITAPQVKQGVKAPKSKSGVVITELRDNDNLPSRQNAKPNMSERQKNTSVGAKKPMDSFSVSKNEKNGNSHGKYNDHKKTQSNNEEEKPLLVSASEDNQHDSKEHRNSASKNLHTPSKNDIFQLSDDNDPETRSNDSRGNGQTTQKLTLKEFNAIAKARWGATPEQLAKFTEWFNDNMAGHVTSWSEKNQEHFDKVSLCTDLMYWHNTYDPDNKHKIVQMIIEHGVEGAGNLYANEIENLHLGEIIDTMNLKEVEKKYLKDYALKKGFNEKDNGQGAPWTKKDVERLFKEWETARKPFGFKVGLMWEILIVKLKSWFKWKKSAQR